MIGSLKLKENYNSLHGWISTNILGGASFDKIRCEIASLDEARGGNTAFSS